MSSVATSYQTTLRDDLAWFLDQCRAPLVRPISQWVEQELILPSGPFRGERYRHRRHPASRLWFEALDAGNWNRFAASGPTQNGKTLMCYVAPVLYHLFELQETVIIGLPTMQMAQDKWTEDLLPAIEASRFATLLPTTGEGSRGGMVKRAIRFRNDVTLRFMAAGGGDKQRAGYTSRVLAITETDGMDQSGENSREADAIEQLEGRTRAYGTTKRVYLECTASIEQGRIWQEIQQGTASRLARPCPYCGQYVSPEREHLVGWHEAESELEAAEKAHWICPDCAHPWTEEERRDAAAAAVLVHRGQKALPTGDVIGDLPPTKTLGFRWSAVDNPFAMTADLGAEEWRASRAADPENAEKKMRQFVWCLPWIPPEVQLTPLTAQDVVSRATGLRKGVVPAETVGIAVGIDTGKRQLHWHAVAIRQDGSAHVVEYGEQKTEADTVGMTRGLHTALLELHEYFSRGWPDETGRVCHVTQAWIDSGYHEHREGVYRFCLAVLGGRPMHTAVYRPAKGYGEGHRQMSRYVQPAKRNRDIRFIGNQYHITHQPADRIQLVHVNGDHWKSELHQRLAMDAGQPGAITLYEAASRHEHDEYSQHLTAERQVEQWIDRRGNVIVWERIRRHNHYLDAGYLSLAAADLVLRSKPEQGRKTLAEMAQMAAGVRKAHG